jgi:hypothetical protein
MYTKTIRYESEPGNYITEYKLFGVCLYRKTVNRNAINVYQ